MTLRPEGEETRVDIESTVDRTLPVPLLERAVARQRRRAVERLAGRLYALVG